MSNCLLLVFIVSSTEKPFGIRLKATFGDLYWFE